MGKDQEWIVMLKAGRGTKAHKRALGHLYKTYRPMLIKRLSSGQFYRFAQFAEDIATQAIMVLEENVQREKEIHNIEGHLWQVAKYKALNVIQKHRRTPPITNNEQQEIPNEHLIATACKELFNKIKIHLGDSCAQLLLLRENNHKAPEIAEKLGYTSKNGATVVRVKLQRCRKRLWKIIEKNPTFQQTLHELFNGKLPSLSTSAKASQ